MYALSKDDTVYSFNKDGKPLQTPMGRPVKTHFESLAKRLLADLETYGENPSDPVSLVAFHYAMTDFFDVMPREELEYSVAPGLDRENDWTFNCPTATPETMMNWMALFGSYSTNAERAKDWLSSLSPIQLCAVTVLGRALESVNIPFIVATMLSRRDVNSYAKSVNAHYPYVETKDLKTYFDNYLFYFTLENPPLVKKSSPKSMKRARRSPV